MVLIFLQFAGCAGGAAPLPRPAEHHDRLGRQVLATRFPHEQFVVGIGRSAASADEASARARAELAKSIESTVRATERMNTRESMASERASSFQQDFSQDIEVTAHLQYGALVQVVDVRDDGSGFVATAVLERAALDTELAREEARLGDEARVLLERLERSAKLEDMPAFARAYPAARDLRSEILRVQASRRALRAPTWAPGPDPLESLDRAEVLAVAVRSRVRVRVVVASGPDTPALAVERTGAAIAEGLASVGLSSERGEPGDPCGMGADTAMDAATFVVALVARPRLEVRYGLLGWSARLSIPATARACSGGDSSQGADLAAAAGANGVHPSIRGAAERRAIAGLEALAVAMGLGEMLGSLVPVVSVDPGDLE